MAWPPEHCLVLDVKEAKSLPKANDYAGVVITGSHDMVTERSDWMLRAAEWLREAVQDSVPILGICFGHQLLAAALGGEVGDNPKGAEFGLADIRKTKRAEDDPLLKDVPAHFRALVSHFQTVIKLPPDAVPLAYSEKDAHQCFRYGRNAWGVQFHPEMDCDIMKVYLQKNREKISDWEEVAKRISIECHAQPESTRILKTFREIVLSGR